MRKKHVAKLKAVVLVFAALLQSIFLHAGTVGAEAGTKSAVVNEVTQKGHLLKGVVTDESGEPLMGVSVRIKGTTTGTMSDLDGKYSIQVSPGQELVFSYVGCAEYKVVVKEKMQTLNVTLKEDTHTLGEVVVTAMGIERKAESLTYATQKIGSKDLTRAKDVNFINALQGKSAGLTITPNSSGAGGGSSKIILRGQSSILGNNQPLIVLDGIPLSNGMSSQTNEIMSSASARDGGDLLSTINPDDIANMSILKGPNAAALYGSAANNGVIIITTKKGQSGRIRIDVSSNITMETPLLYPKSQQDFAPVISGTGVEFDGWGKPVSEITDEDIANYPYLTRNPRNNVKDFFNLGQTYNNSITLSGGSENSTTYFSYGNTAQKGLIDGNKFMRHNLMFKESLMLFDKKLKLDLSINYITQKANNRPTIGKGFGPLYSLYRTPSAVNLRYFDLNRTRIAEADDEWVTAKPWGNKNLKGYPVQNFPWTESVWVNNPYFMLDAISDEALKDRIMSSFSARYNIIEGLSAQGRISVDKTTDDGVALNAPTIRIGEKVMTVGRYWRSQSNHREIYADFLMTYDKKIQDAVSVNVTGGTSMKRIRDRSSWLRKETDSTYVDPTVIWPMEGINGSQDPKKLAGSILDADDTDYTTNWEAAVFAVAQIGFWDKGYIDVSFRNDWSKAFQQFTKGDRYMSFPYYSVGGNLLLKELWMRNATKVNSLKVRLSYSVVGNSVPAEFYAAQKYNPMTGAWSGVPATFDDPKPETTKAIEAGIDGMFFNNRLDFDLTVYQSKMEHQFLKITTSSGQNKPINSGIVRNRGIEFSANYRMRFGKDFRWNTGLNLAYNDNKILKTYEPKEGGSYELIFGPSSVSMQTKFLKGGSYGDLYGKDYEYGADGKIKRDAEGKPMITQTFDRFIGNTTAKFTFGWNNTFSYKNFTLYMLLDGKIGGKVISLTEAEMDYYGLSERSAKARKNGGVVTLPDGTTCDARTYYETVGTNQFDCVYNATNLRVREISLGYTFYELFGPSKNLTLSLIARNLGFLYKDAPVDPDISVTAGNTFGGVDAFALPTTRSFGFNIKVSF